jgi:hypothetical protein
MTFKWSSHNLRSPLVWGVVLCHWVLDISRQCGALIFKHQSVQKWWNFRYESPTDIAPHPSRRLQLHWCRRPKTVTVLNGFKALPWHSLTDYQVHALKHLDTYNNFKILTIWYVMQQEKKFWNNSSCDNTRYKDASIIISILPFLYIHMLPTTKLSFSTVVLHQ